jgi:Uma2 family endonuclease
MAAKIDFYSGDSVRALNAHQPKHWPRYETVHGELLVSPAPKMLHHVVVENLVFALRVYLRRERVGQAFGAPADISWGRDDVCVQPDAFVIPRDEMLTLDWRQIRHLLLAVEVLSPSSIRADRFTKRRLYQEQGTPLYWIIDPGTHSAELWTSEATFPRTECERLVWHPAGASSPFVITLDELVRPT